MIRRVHLQNFVKFKEAQTIEFAEEESPYIFVGENGSGKSSLLEGIRRCVSQKTSTTKSSVFDKSKSGFCICKYDTRKCSEKALKGFQFMFTGIIRNQKENSDIIYKFALTKTELLINKYDEEDNCYQFETKENTNEYFGKLEDNNFDFATKFYSQFTYTPTKCSESALERRLDELENHVIFTFPLRSIGALQWTKSDKITPAKRRENYKEAGEREEIIRYFLNKQDEFDVKVEQEIFRDLTGHSDIQFKGVDDGGINVYSTNNDTLLPEQEYALLKLPEGILEAKHFSILMSNKQFLTIILEEPDRGMHPQMVDRMMAIIQKQRDKKLVLLTTHNTSFVSPMTITRLVIFKRINDHTETVLGKTIAKIKLPRMGKQKFPIEAASMKTLRILTQDHFADLIFAKRILFCEGDSDYLFLSALKAKVMRKSPGVMHLFGNVLTDYNIDTLQRVCVSLQIINMNGWENAHLMHILCSDSCLKLDNHYFVCDKDAILTGGDEEVTNDNKWLATETGFKAIRKEYKENRDSGKDAWDEARKSLRDLCKCFTWKDGTIEDMVISLLRSETEINPLGNKESYTKPYEYNQELSWKEKKRAIDELQDQNVHLPYTSWKKRRHQRENKDTKLFLSSEITQENIEESLEILLKVCNDKADDLVQFILFLLRMENA